VKKIVWSLLTVVVCLASFTPAFADTPEHGLGISPIRQEVTLAAGTSYAGTLAVTNDTATTMTVDMYADAFKVADEQYTYTFLDTSPLNQWIRFEQPTFTLLPHAQTTVNYTLGAPVTATPGAKYFSLFAATSGQPDHSGIAVSERVGALLYVTIPGDPSHTGKLLGLNAPVVAFSAINWSEKVNNTGANYFTSKYKVSLQSLWGSEVSSQSDSAVIISSSVRLVEGTLPAPQWLGLYRVTAQFSLGDNGTQTNSRWVLYLPPSQALPLLLLLIIGIGFGMYRRSRRQNSDKTPS
jgi:hypothetical protein